MRKPFIAKMLFQRSGVSMKTAFAVVVALLIACLLAAGCLAQSTSRFQSVGGDYGRNVISSLKAPAPDSQSTAASDNSSNNSLWNWGTAPKGSMIQNGKLVADPFYVWSALNLTNGWLGETDVDPYTGNQIYSYVDPNTGETKSFYMDPGTGKPVFVDRGANGYSPVYGSVSPFYSNGYGGSYVLPPVFNSNAPWS
jgi:hypothetical protein